MKKPEYETLIAQNDEAIKKKEQQIKKLHTEIKELKRKNQNLKDDMILYQVKQNINTTDLNKLIMISKLMEESGLTENEIKEMFSKGE